ncbi:hypothetical protein D3C78_1316100 [compost metagenome]
MPVFCIAQFDLLQPHGIIELITDDRLGSRYYLTVVQVRPRTGAVDVTGAVVGRVGKRQHLAGNARNWHTGVLQIFTGAVGRQSHRVRALGQKHFDLFGVQAGALHEVVQISHVP